jgi:hypothetical protein
MLSCSAKRNLVFKADFRTYEQYLYLEVKKYLGGYRRHNYAHTSARRRKTNSKDDSKKTGKLTLL